MRDTVGLRSHITIFLPKEFKRDALMFRRIGVPDCAEMIDFIDQLSGKDSADEFQWLIESFAMEYCTKNIKAMVNMEVVNQGFDRATIPQALKSSSTEKGN